MHMETNHSHDNTFFIKMIKWNDVLTKDNWHFDSIMDPEIYEENSNIEKVTQYPNGSIDLKILRSHSFNKVSSSRRMSFYTPSDIKYVDEREITLKDTERKLKWVWFLEIIPKVEYEPKNLKI